MLECHYYLLLLCYCDSACLCCHCQIRAETLLAPPAAPAQLSIRITSAHAHLVGAAWSVNVRHIYIISFWIGKTP